jgi:hypothetical protein
MAILQTPNSHNETHKEPVETLDKKRVAIDWDDGVNPALQSSAYALEARSALSGMSHRTDVARIRTVLSRLQALLK